MKKQILLLSILNVLIFSTYADPIITFFFHPYPDPQKISNKLKKTGKIARHTLEGLAHYQPITGIFCTYAGYLAASDHKGQIIFPRKHEKPFLYLIITNTMIPITMFENTIHHWEFDPAAPAQMFTLDQKKDPETELMLWNTQPTPLPEDRIIPLESLVILAKPKHIYVPTGMSLTYVHEPNVLLPDLYVKKGINIIKNALYLLNISHLFGPVRTTTTVKELKTSTMKRG